MADVRIQQYPLKSIVSDNDIFLIADSNDVDVNGFLKYKKVRAKDLPSIVNTAESITYANLMASIAADDLIIGTFYKITDSTSGVSPLLVQAVGIDAIGYLAFDASNPLVTINYDVMTDTIRWSKNETAAPISLGSLSATTPLSYNNTTGVFTISQSNATTNGYLSSADWNTFTAKQNAGNYITALTGEATASGPVGGGSAAITLSNSAVIGKVLSGLNITGGNVVSTDSILTAFGKTQNQINALVGGVMFQGVWDAATNNPALTSSVGTKGYYYVVNVAGSTNLNGITDWKVGDWAIFDGTAWQKVDNTDSVSSVFGRVGAVVATEGDYSLTQLSDVTLSSPSNGQVLKYNGTAWVNGTDIDTGLTSVGLTMPSAFSVANSPLTANGTLAVTGAGVASQYVRGDGTLAAFPTTTGGGSSVSYYFNGGTNQGTIGGNTYYEMSTTAVIGTGADFNINTNGYIAQFVTDANDPSLLSIPAGNWNFEMWFSASSNGGSPSFYLELYKYNGATLTLISSGSAVPESITNGTAIDLYTTALAVPLTTLTLTDRLAVRVYVNNSSRTITLHTQNGHLCQAITTFSTGLTALNGLTSQVQYLAVGTSGTDFTISSASSTHTFNLPTASASNRGALSSADWTTFNNKQNALTNPITGTGTTNYLPKFTGASALGNSQIFDNGTNVGIGTTTPTSKLHVLDSVNTYSSIFQGVGGTSFVALGTKTGNVPTINGFTANFAGTANIALQADGGNVLIGTTTNASGYKLQVAGLQQLKGDNTLLNFGELDTNNVYFQSLNTAANASKGIVFYGAAEYMRIASGGNVGIGTTSPSDGKLQIAGNTQIGNTIAQTYFGVGASAIKITSNGAFAIGLDGADGSTERMRIAASGNVLIGTTTDAGYKLDVNGTARVSADATINEVTVGKGAGNIGNNTVVGRNALVANTTGSINTTVGYLSLQANTTGSSNTAMGFAPLFANTTGSFNTAYAASALESNTTGSNNTAIGYTALYSNNASNNTAVGFEAAKNNTSGTNLTALGYQALRNNTTGNFNTAIGNSAAILNTTGSSNVALGLSALYSNTTGSNNVAIGKDSLALNNASNNTAIGFEAAYKNTIGEENTAIGYRALRENTTGYTNTAVGYDSLRLNTTGHTNTVLGVRAGSDNTTGVINIVIGASQATGNNSQTTMIGVADTATGSNQMRFGSAAIVNGAVATEVNASSKVWNVFINGVAQKILLA